MSVLLAIVLAVGGIGAGGFQPPAGGAASASASVGFDGGDIDASQVTTRTLLADAGYISAMSYGGAQGGPTTTSFVDAGVLTAITEIVVTNPSGGGLRFTDGNDRQRITWGDGRYISAVVATGQLQLNSFGLNIPDGPLVITNTKSNGTCTLNGASPSACTATVNASSSKCSCTPVGTTAADAFAVASSVSGTTLTCTAANGKTNDVVYHCF